MFSFTNVVEITTKIKQLQRFDAVFTSEKAITKKIKTYKQKNLNKKETINK